MDATPVLERIARAMEEIGLEAVLIGNAAAAAALRGAPVTTIDVDFFFHWSPATVAKLKLLAKKWGALLLRPHYPVSGLYRISLEDEGLQFDFMSQIHGARSYSTVRGHAGWFPIGRGGLWVASLADIVKSKRAAGRPRDRAELELIRKRLALPPDKRMNFLRKRIGIGISAL